MGGLGGSRENTATAPCYAGYTFDKLTNLTLGVSMQRANNPVVFISYAHEGFLQAQVKALADWLTEHQVQVITDHPYTNRPPEQGWRAWMQHSVEDADLVLIVCTERYKRLFEKREVPDEGGRGVTWESAVITIVRRSL